MNKIIIAVVSSIISIIIGLIIFIVVAQPFNQPITTPTTETPTETPITPVIVTETPIITATPVIVTKTPVTSTPVPISAPTVSAPIEVVPVVPTEISIPPPVQIIVPSTPVLPVVQTILPTPTPNNFLTCEQERQDYLARYPDVKAANVDPWEHYKKAVLDGEARTWNGGMCQANDLIISKLSNCQQAKQDYLARYPDVKAAGIDAWQHFLKALSSGENRIWNSDTCKLIVGSSVKCSANGFDSTNVAVYRYMGDNTLRHYTTPEIAASHDPNWGTFELIDCNGLQKGPDMTFKFTPIVPDYQKASNSDQCLNASAFVRVGDNRCLTDSQCKYANYIDKTSRDCTKLPKST